MTRPVVVISASIGAGHDGSAREICRRLTSLGFPVLRHDFLDLLPPGLGSALRSTYARQLRTAPATWGWLLRATAGPRMSAQAAALATGAAATRMLAAIDPAAAAVVSTYPLATQVLGRLRRCGRITAPTAAVVTDPSVHPLCVAPGIDVHLAPGLPIAAQVRRLGFAAVAVSPIVDPGVSTDPPPCRESGSPPPARAAGRRATRGGRRRFLGGRRCRADRAGHPRQPQWVPVVVCGHNDLLHRRLSRSGDAIALGWIDTMPELLRAADVVVHNAGGLSSVEAMASGVPLISYRCLPGHGAANAAVLATANLSPWPHTPHELAAELSLALDGSAILRQQAALATATASADAAEVIAGLAGILAPAATPSMAP